MSKGNLIKMGLTCIALAGLLCLVGLPPQASAQAQEFTIHETTTSPGMMGQPPTKTTATIYMGRVGMKRVGSEGNDSIIRFDKGVIILINHKDKTYSEVTQAQLQEIADKTAASMVKNKEQLEMMRKMMGQVSENITVTKEGPGDKMLGFDTVKYRVTGMMETEVWAAPDLKISPLYYESIKVQIPPNPLFDMRKVTDEFKKIDGMSLKTVMTFRMMNNEMKTTTVVDSIERKPLEDSLFEPPAGYKKVEPNLGK